MSAGKFSWRRTVRDFRATFAAEWSAYIRARFETPEEAAVYFAVDASTARHWWHGLNRPTGDCVCLAFCEDHDRATKMLGRK